MSIELTDWEFFDDIEEGYRKFFFSYVKVYFFWIILTKWQRIISFEKNWF